MIPNPFIGIQVRRIGRELIGFDTPVTAQELLHQSGSVVDVDPVPDDAQWSLELTGKKPKEVHDILCLYVPVVGQQLEVEPQPISTWADRDCADRRDPVVARPALLDGGLPSWRIGSADQGREHEA